MSDLAVDVLHYGHLVKLLPQRAPDSHKGLFGRVLIIGGDYGMPGAVRMAGEAALRVGAGLVTIITQPEHIAVITAMRPELLCYGVSIGADISALLNTAIVVAIGPGLGQSAWSKGLLAQVLSSALPLVVDADALNLLAKSPRLHANWILTPHVGEAARLLNTNPDVIQADRISAVQNLQKKYNGVIVLKGAGSLICGRQKNVAICHAGNPGMATAGMGDILTGIIAGLLAQGIKNMDAAQLGVYLHATAGDQAKTIYGERGLLALDLLQFLCKLINP